MASIKSMRNLANLLRSGAAEVVPGGYSLTVAAFGGPIHIYWSTDCVMLRHPLPIGAASDAKGFITGETFDALLGTLAGAAPAAADPAQVSFADAVGRMLNTEERDSLKLLGLLSERLAAKTPPIQPTENEPVLRTTGEICPVENEVGELCGAAVQKNMATGALTCTAGHELEDSPEEVVADGSKDTVKFTGTDYVAALRQQNPSDPIQRALCILSTPPLPDGALVSYKEPLPPGTTKGENKLLDSVLTRLMGRSPVTEKIAFPLYREPRAITVGSQQKQTSHWTVQLGFEELFEILAGVNELAREREVDVPPLTLAYEAGEEKLRARFTTKIEQLRKDAAAAKKAAA